MEKVLPVVSGPGDLTCRPLLLRLAAMEAKIDAVLRASSFLLLGSESGLIVGPRESHIFILVGNVATGCVVVSALSGKMEIAAEKVELYCNSKVKLT